MRERLLQDMKEAGIDTDATVDGRLRINVATWGMETALNRFAFCQNVILAGVLQRSPVDIAAAYLGQTDNLRGEIEADEVRDLLRSECTHSVYQALSRGVCRNVRNGQALPQRSWIIHRDIGLQKELSRVMPGVRFKTWEPVATKKPNGKRSGIIAATAMKVREHLSGLSPAIVKLSVRELKAGIDAKGVAPQTWKYALKAALDDCPEWIQTGQRLERQTRP